MSSKIRTHLMFDGDAEAAMDFYVSLFPGSVVLASEKYESGDFKGKLLVATFSLKGHEFSCADSPVKHEFSFTPSASIFVDCEDVDEFEKTLAALSVGGQLLMPADNYGFSRRFAWLNDRFGVSWQINQP